MSGAKFQGGDVFGWFTSAIKLAMKNPGVFIVMALIYAVIAVIPIINFAMVIIGPALMGGFVYAAREEEAGRKAEIGHLFAAFQQPGKIGPMIMLCLPAIAAGILSVVIMFVFGAGAIMAMAAGGGGSPGMGFGGMLIGGLLCMVILIAASFLLYFAVPRVMLDGVEPITAMKESLSTALANLLPLVAAFVCIGIIYIIAFAVLMWIPFLGPLALMLVASLAGAISMYYAHKTVFGGATEAAAAMPPAPPPVGQ